MKKLNFLWIFLFITAIICSMYTIRYCLQYDISAVHDMVYAYGRKFFHPEHGRYIASFTSYLLIEVLPEIFNIHPNDFAPMFISFVKGIVVIISCLVFANAAFLFTKEDNKNILKFPISNPCYTVVYALVFLTLFNDNFFFNGERVYFSVFESVVFFEYPASIYLYAAVMSIFGYYFINNKIPDKTTYTIFLILLFFLGITVEPLNLPAFAGFVLFLPYILINRKNLKDNKKYIIYFCVVYLVSLFCYYIRPNEHAPEYQGTFVNYVKTAIVPYLHSYWYEFILNNSRALLPVVLLFIPAFFIDRERAKRLVYFVIANIAGFWCFYALIFFIGYMTETYSFYFYMDKWINIYRVITLFYLIFVIGFVFDTKSKNISNILKVVTCLFIFILFHKNLITEYMPKMEETLNRSKEIRTASYILEKLAVSSDLNDNEFIVPNKFEHYNSYFMFDQYECGYTVYLHNVYPKINKTKSIFADDDSIIDSISFDDNELKQLKFANLQKEKMYRHKKVITNCY